MTAAAYDQLLAEGWAEGRRGAGTFVVGPPARAVAAAEPAPAPVRGGPGPVDLYGGKPCLEVLDPAGWRRAWRAAADPPADDGPDPVGWPPFRAAVVEHLLRHRGLPADPGRVLATAGSTAGDGRAGPHAAVRAPGWPSRSPVTSGPSARCGTPG